MLASVITQRTSIFSHPRSSRSVRSDLKSPGFSLNRLFTFGEKKLLFAGDAQGGNWEYWMYGGSPTKTPSLDKIEKDSAAILGSPARAAGRSPGAAGPPAGTDRQADLAGPLALLAARYPRYRAAPPAGPLIRIQVGRWTGWAAAGGP